jgi:hypothetical protein
MDTNNNDAIVKSLEMTNIGIVSPLFTFTIIQKIDFLQLHQ